MVMPGVPPCSAVTVALACVQTNDPAAMWVAGGPGSRQGGLTFTGGCLMPFGLHKGSGLSLMCALLAGGLSGGGTERPENQTGPGPILNHVYAVFIDPRAVEAAGGAVAHAQRVLFD